MGSPRRGFPVLINDQRYQVDERKIEWSTLPVTREQIHDSGASGEAALVQYVNWKQTRTSFHHGSGQSLADHPELSDPNRYHHSMGLNPSERGRMQLPQFWRRDNGHHWARSSGSKDPLEDGSWSWWLEESPANGDLFLIDGRLNVGAVRLAGSDSWQTDNFGDLIAGIYLFTEDYRSQRIKQVLPWKDGVIVIPDLDWSAVQRPGQIPELSNEFIYYTSGDQNVRWVLDRNNITPSWDSEYTTFMSDGDYVFAFYEAPNQRAVVQMNPQFSGANFTFNEEAIGADTNYYFGPIDMFVDSMTRHANALYFYNADTAGESKIDNRIWFMDIDAETGAFSGLKVAAELPNETVRSLSFFNDLVGITTDRGVRLGTVNNDGSLTFGDLFASRNGCDHGIFWNNRFVFSFRHSPALEQLHDPKTVIDQGMDTRISASSLGFIDLSNQYAELGASIFETNYVASHYKCVPDNLMADDTQTVPGLSLDRILVNYPIRGIKTFPRRTTSSAFGSGQGGNAFRQNELFVMSFSPEFNAAEEQVHVHRYDEVGFHSGTWASTTLWERWAPDAYQRPFFDTGWISFGTIEKKVAQVLEVGITRPEFMNLYVYYRSDLIDDWTLVEIQPLSVWSQQGGQFIFSSKTRVARISLGALEMHERVEFRLMLVSSTSHPDTEIDWWAMRAAPAPQTYDVVTLPVILHDVIKHGRTEVSMDNLASEFSVLRDLAEQRASVPIQVGALSFVGTIDSVEMREQDVDSWDKGSDFPEHTLRVRVVIQPTFESVVT